MLRILIMTTILSLISCSQKVQKTNAKPTVNNPSIVVLGTIQDAGYPQIGCKKECCTSAFNTTIQKKSVVSLGIIDPNTEKAYLLEATPDMVHQLNDLGNLSNSSSLIDGIFLTHGHIGHYTGLMYLGKEAMDAKQIPVYAMPRMMRFLSKNGPWNLLIERKNIVLNGLQNKQTITLTKDIKITPILVPHRDEYSETVGYIVNGPSKSALFIPDIDKWTKWETSIIEEVKKVDYAFLDATFFSGKEINNRDISQIPHPFVIESLETFKVLPKGERSKIHFIHFNHTNPIINLNSPEAKQVLDAGYNIAQKGQIFEL